jgi:pyruvate kinase
MGPASGSEEVLRKLIHAGMDVVRMNFSHGSHEDHLDILTRVRRLSEEMESNTTILLDLQGPKMRVGNLKEPLAIKKGDRVIFRTDIDEPNGNELPMQYETFAADVRKGDLVLVDDGKVDLLVVSSDGKARVELEVVGGDKIASRKGVNLPFTHISMPSISKKDWRDIAFAIEHKVDWIALSFVRSPDEVKLLKEYLRTHECYAKVMAKIEKPEALKNIDEIIEASDGIMVARGDLGVEVPMEEVPMWQKIIVKKCNRAAKPVIVATQMMESMMENRRPTRAETTDVANAVLDGADAVMLSGETSVGKYPVETVQSMQKIISIMESRTMEEETGIFYRNLVSDPVSPTYLNDSVIVTACQLARQIKAEALVGMTVSGYTAFHLSKCRPKAHIYIFTQKKEMLPVLNLVWGVRAFYYDKYVGTDETFEDTTNILKAKGFLKKGDIVIQTASMPIAARHRTNMLKVETVE